jgi:hypothetical protein
MVPSRKAVTCLLPLVGKTCALPLWAGGGGVLEGKTLALDICLNVRAGRGLFSPSLLCRTLFLRQAIFCILRAKNGWHAGAALAMARRGNSAVAAFRHAACGAVSSALPFDWQVYNDGASATPVHQTT